MNFQNQSPLDKSPIYDRILELIKSGEFNTSIANTISTEYNVSVGESAIRRFRRRHNVQIPGAERASTTIKGDEATATTKPRIAPSDDPPILDDPDNMLRERGLDPEDWFIDQITVNEWEGRTKDGNKVTNHQAKFTAKRKRPELLLTPVRSDGWKPTHTSWIPHITNTPQLVVICGDQQAPFHDKKLHKAFCEWLEINKPDRGVLLGDLLDFPDVSRHDDDPDNVAAVNECLQAGYDIVRDYVAASPGTEWEFLLGNHDQRIKTYIIKHAPRIHNLKRVSTSEHPDTEFVHSLEHLMRLDELGVELVVTNGPYEDAQVTLSPHLAVRHGWVVRSGSGSTALKTLEQTGYSIVVGHVHRQSLVYHTTHDIDRNPTTLVAAEAGCMCQLDGKIDPESGRRFPSYTVLPDWQQGFCVARIHADGKHHLSLATYVNETLLWEGQEIKVKNG